MNHLVVGFYIMIELAGIWIVVLSYLYYHMGKNKAFLYFALFFGSTMLMLLCEITIAYWKANSISPSFFARMFLSISYGFGQLLHFFSVLRLAYAIIRLRISLILSTIHLSLLVLYAFVIGILLLRKSDFEPQHIALGIAQFFSMIVILRFRKRLYPKLLRDVTMQFIGVGLFFAPMIDFSIYTHMTDYLPFGKMTFQIFYALVAEVLLTYHVINHLYNPSSKLTSPVEEGMRIRNILSLRELEIARLVSNGYTNREIAALLNISNNTVKNHLYHIYKKLDVRNRIELLNNIELFR